MQMRRQPRGDVAVGVVATLGIAGQGGIEEVGQACGGGGLARLPAVAQAAGPVGLPWPQVEVVELQAGGTIGAGCQALRRSEERRVGKECVSKGRYWWSPYH